MGEDGDVFRRAPPAAWTVCSKLGAASGCPALMSARICPSTARAAAGPEGRRLGQFLIFIAAGAARHA